MDNLSTMYPGWEIVETLGTGSFGKVYKIKKITESGDDEYFSALKHICVPREDDEITQYRNEGYDEESIKSIYRNKVSSIKSEIQMMSKLKGVTNIVSYEDHCIIPHSDKIGYDILIRMELLTPLPKYMTEHELGENDIIKLGCDICKALELCEKSQIIHRDIKPQNIFVNSNGDYKLGDFGIAKTYENTTFGTLSGSYPYMAPEVIFRQKYNSKIDQYSLAIVLYWALNNKRTPFMPLPPSIPSDADYDTAQSMRLSGEQFPPSLKGSQAIQGIIARAAAFNPSDRYESPAKMRIAMESLQSGEEPGSGTVSMDFDDTQTIYMRNRRKKSKSETQRKKASKETKQKTGKKTKPLYIGVAVILLAAIIALIPILGGDSNYRTFIDEGTGVSISGNIEKHAEFTVETFDPEDGEYADTLESGYEAVSIYDLSLNGSYNGNLTVSFPLAETYEGSEIVIVHKGESKTERISSTVEDCHVSVDCSELSPFILMVSALEVEPEAILLDFTTLGMVVGSTEQLTASFIPENSTDKPITWISTDESVVKVDEAGKLTAVASGVAEIKACYDELETSCIVTVSDEEVLPTGISVSRKNLTLSVSETAYLSVSIVPKNATSTNVTWRSSNPSVASVNNGRIRAISAGTTTITASIGSFSAKCAVTVNAPVAPTPSPTNVSVSSVSLSTSSVKLEVGKTFKLTCTVSPSDASNASVAWKSSDSAVASVSNGTISAKSAGTAVITATAGGKSASCTVTVTNPKGGEDIKVTSVSLNKSTLIMETGDTSQLTATVSPSNAVNASVSWQSSNPSVASVSNGTVTAKSSGTTTVTATAGEKSASCTVTVKKPESSSAPSGYSISIGNPSSYLTGDSRTVCENIDFSIYVYPNESNYTNITLYAISPYGDVYTFNMGTSTSKGLNCYIAGRWQVYAVVTNEYGTYSGKDNGPYLTFDVVSLY